ncbi:MAG: hypothetical protein A2341_28135 [Deltaproteobacteria bacterium RIFOXYB12_FULL_58_9]|nr:MAG: hypothetical protein A2341_28135 [Deltaproteobacteria bacterium RIFOXYB12_FULL_58_9]
MSAESREGDTNAGRPAPGELPSPDPSSVQSVPRAGGRRAGDSGTGRPCPKVEFVETPSAGEIETADRIDQRLWEPDFDDPLLKASDGPSWFGWTVAAGAALVGLYLYSHALSALALLSGILEPWRSVAFAGLLLLVGVVVIAGARLAFVGLRLRANHQLPVLELYRRGASRQLAARGAAEAHTLLVAYLRGFSLNRSLPPGLDRAVTQCLTDERATLLDPDLRLDAASWRGRFEDRFLSILDAAAKGRIKHHAFMAGAKTAVAPNGLIDILVVGYYGMALMTDLCRIYNLRTNRWDTARLFGRFLLAVYVAGETGDAALDLYDHFHGLINATVPNRTGRGLASRAAEGAVNAAMLHRIGRAAQKALRPVEMR